MSELVLIIQIIRDASAGIEVARELLSQITALCRAGKLKEAREAARAYKRESAAHAAADEAARRASPKQRSL